MLSGCQRGPEEPALLTYESKQTIMRTDGPTVWVTNVLLELIIYDLMRYLIINPIHSEAGFYLQSMRSLIAK